MIGKRKTVAPALLAAVLLLVAAVMATIGGTALAAHAATESKIALSISSYSGEWKADPANPGLTRPQNAIDGNADTAWYCQWGRANNRYGDAPRMTLSLGGQKTVCRVEVTMADDFVPQDLLVEVGNGSAWAEAGRFAGMTAKQKIVCDVPNQTADKLRVTVMEKSKPDNNGFTLCKIAEIAAYATSAAAIDALPYFTDVTTGGIVLCSDDAQNAAALSDGVFTEEGHDGGTVVAKFYTDYTADTAQTDALVAYRFAAAKEIGKLTLWGFTKEGELYGFPRDFAVVFSPDGEKWYVVPNQVYYDFEPTGGENAFVFDNKISARAVGIKVLTSSPLFLGGYGVSLAEMRVFSSPLGGNAYAPTGQDTADAAAITARSIENAVSDGTKPVTIDLSQYFSCTAGTLAYTVVGIGSVTGHTYTADVSQMAAGRYDVTVTASLNDFCRKSTSFTLTVQTGGKLFVTAVAETVARTATTADDFVCDLSELFRYGGAESLLFTASQGEVSGSTLRHRFDVSGTYEITIGCWPVSDASLGATVTLQVNVTRGGVEMNPLASLASTYESPASAYALAGGLAGGLAAAGVAITAVLLIRRRKAK